MGPSSVCIFISVLVLRLLTSDERVSYEGHKLYKVYPYNEKQAQHLKTLEKNSDIHFLSRVVRGKRSQSVYVLVSPEVEGLFSKSLAQKNIQSNVAIKNFERILELERTRIKRASEVPPGEINFDTYHRPTVINDYVNSLSIKYPHRASLLNIGSSTENRDILALRISSGDKSKSNPIILIDAGILAREWIAPAQALYIIQQLVENPDYNNLTQNVDWIIVPVMNPDGYEYTHTIDRLWRKTRSKGINCTGTDANRNFDFHWREEGATPDECSKTYRGFKPFSEPETRALRDLMLQYADQIKLYISFHSFGQEIIYPWSYTTELAPNAEELQFLGDNVAKAIKEVSGTHYNVNATSLILYQAAGTSQDWSKGVAGINLQFTLELPPSQYSPIQFQLPAQYIKNVVLETFEGVKVFHDYIEKIKG